MRFIYGSIFIICLLSFFSLLINLNKQVHKGVEIASSCYIDVKESDTLFKAFKGCVGIK